MATYLIVGNGLDLSMEIPISFRDFKERKVESALNRIGYHTNKIYPPWNIAIEKLL